jgi:hypothetical protein
MSKPNDVVNALKRLERAGSESSRATEKLMGAAVDVAVAIEKACPAELVGQDLADGYIVTRVRSSVGSDLFLVRGPEEDGYGDSPEWIDGNGSYLHGDFNAWIPDSTRAGVLQFAQDIASGLLDRIAERFEQAAAKDAALTATLENAQLPE